MKYVTELIDDCFDTYPIFSVFMLCTIVILTSPVLLIATCYSWVSKQLQR